LYVEAHGTDRYKLRQAVSRVVGAMDLSDLLDTALAIHRREHRERVQVDDDLALIVEMAESLYELRHARLWSLDHRSPPG
jgi:hypothetical protein